MSGYLAALVEEILDPGARCEIAHEFEFRPEAIEFLFAFLVQNELDQRRIITKIAHHIVIAGAEQAAFVFGIVGIETATLADIEGVWKNVSELREGRFIG